LRIWEHLYRSGFDARSASDAMNCSRRTAAKKLAEVGDRIHSAIDRNDRNAKDVSVLAARPTSESSSFPAECLELADFVRNDHCGRYNRQRNVLAAGIPYAEITPTDAVSRADADLKAAVRYHDRWAQIDAQGAQP